MRMRIPCACGRVELEQSEWKKTLFLLIPKDGTVHYTHKCGILFHPDDDPCDPVEFVEGVINALHQKA